MQKAKYTDRLWHFFVCSWDSQSRTTSLYIMSNLNLYLILIEQYVRKMYLTEQFLMYELQTNNTS